MSEPPRAKLTQRGSERARNNLASTQQRPTWRENTGSSKAGLIPVNGSLVPLCPDGEMAGRGAQGSWLALCCLRPSAITWAGPTLDKQRQASEPGGSRSHEGSQYPGNAQGCQAQPSCPVPAALATSCPPLHSPLSSGTEDMAGTTSCLGRGPARAGHLPKMALTPQKIPFGH